MAQIYRKIEKLSASTPNVSIAPLASYAHLAEVLAVPIAWFEAWSAAQDRMILWRDSPGGKELFVVCKDGLLANPRSARFLIVAAYPFTASMHGSGNDATVMIDASSPLMGAKVANVFSDDGSFSNEAELRLESLWLFLNARQKTQAITDWMAQSGAFAPLVHDHETSDRIEGAYCIKTDWTVSEAPAEIRNEVEQIVQSHFLSLKYSAGNRRPR